MLAKKFRLPGHLIPQVLQKGKTTHFKYFFLKFLASTSNSQFTFVVSPKISKKAVIRNKIKRRLSNALKGNLADFKPKMQIIFLAKKEILKADYQEIEVEVKQAIEKIST